MIKKFGKPIDVVKFKGSMLNTDTLRALIEKYKQTSLFYIRTPNVKGYQPARYATQRTGLWPRLYTRYPITDAISAELYILTNTRIWELKKYYASSKEYSKQSYSDKSTYRYRARETSLPKIEFISKFITASQKRWLDVGSGIGDVVYNLNKKGFDARGLEVSEESIKFSKKMFNIGLENKTVYDLLKEDGPGSFDVISYFGVIEHMPEPLKQISCAVRLLKPGGILVLEVPSANSFSVMADIFFPDSVVRQMVPAFHIMLFSEKSLLHLSKRFNLKPEAMWFLGLDFFNFILHLSLRIPGFMESDLCKKILHMNNDIQSVFDSNEMSDEIIFVCRKGAKHG